ncbi:MAG: acyltransferase [Candidatus Electrothrix sp. LOE1_4_5]|nr:acyltransferase [Candidatus Electrothrix gigas]
MFGYYRFFLATFVLISHLDFNLHGFNIGVASVVSFYMLAGYVVCNLLTDVFTPGKNIYARFYSERILRIYPQYLFVVLLTVIFAVFSKKLPYQYDFYIFLKNILIVPVNYYMFNNISFFTERNYAIVPISFSLGLELQAYILLPFIVFYKNIRIISSIISMFIFFAACFGWLHTDYYGYRLLPGVLFIFNVGVCLAIASNSPEKISAFDKNFPPVIFGLTILFSVLLGVFGRSHVLRPNQIIVGILISIPTITYLSSFKRKVVFNRFMGDISYGIFLSHYLALWIVQLLLEVDRKASPYTFAMLVFFFSFLIAAVGVLGVEKIFVKKRYRLAKPTLGSI